MSHIVSLQAENVKRLRAVRITPTGPIVSISGANGSGKTSVLDSIAMALGGKDQVPAMPVRKGEDSAEIVVTLDSGIQVRRTFTAAGNSYLRVVSAEGAVFSSPQAMLDKLTGSLSFDPLAFLRLDDAKQAETLRRLVGLDLSKQDAERKRLYEERTVVNKRLAEMRGAVQALPAYPEAPAAEVSSAEVLKQIEAAQQHNAQQTALAAAVTSAQNAENQCASAIARSNASIAALEKQLAAARAQLAKDQKAAEVACAAVGVAQKALLSFTPVETAALKATLSAAEETNRKVRANVQRAKAIAEGQAKKAESDALTKRIEALDQAKSDALAALKMPVAGLSFTDTGISFNEIPLAQASAAEQLRVSVAIGAALNSRLKVMLIRDGSLLDETSMEALRALAEEMGLQVWIEIVGKGEACSVVISDGEVEGAEPVTPIVSEKPATTRKRAAKAPAAPLATTPAAAAPVDDPFALPAPDSVPANAAF